MSKNDWHRLIQERHEQNGFILEYRCKLSDGKYFIFDAYKPDSRYAIREFVHTLSESYITKAEALKELSSSIVWVFDCGKFKSLNNRTKNKKTGAVANLATPQAMAYINKLTKLKQDCILDCGNGYKYWGNGIWYPLDDPHPLREYMQFPTFNKNMKERGIGAREQILLYLRAQKCHTSALQSDDEILAVASLAFGTTTSSFEEALEELIAFRTGGKTTFHKNVVHKNLEKHWAHLRYVWDNDTLDYFTKREEERAAQLQAIADRKAKNKQDCLHAVERKAAKRARHKLLMKAQQPSQKLSSTPQTSKPKPKPKTKPAKAKPKERRPFEVVIRGKNDRIKSPL